MIGNAAYCYYNRSKDLTVFGQPATDVSIDTIGSLDDLLDWLESQLSHQAESRSARELLEIYWDEYLEGLPHEGLRRAEKEAGLDHAKKSFGFRRYVLERHDIGMDEFLRQHLSDEDYAFHRSAGAA